MSLTDDHRGKATWLSDKWRTDHLTRLPPKCVLLWGYIASQASRPIRPTRMYRFYQADLGNFATIR